MSQIEYPESTICYRKEEMICVVLCPVKRKMLLDTVKQQTRENQIGFRSGRGNIHQMFTLRQILGLRYSYHRPSTVEFLDLKAVSGSLDRQVLWQCPSLKGAPEKYVNRMKVFYSNTTGRATA